MKTIQANARRKFLLAAGFGGAATIGAISAARRTPLQAAVAGPAQPEGYRVTAHILDYYRTART